MASLRARPRFTLITQGTPGQVVDCLMAELQNPERQIRGKVVGRHVQLTVPDDEQHVWSPYVDLDVEGHADGVRIRGLVGPHPSVWTLVVTVYAALAFSALLALVFGYAQWSLGMTAIGFWGVPLTVVLAGIVFGCTLIGRRLATSQTARLRQFVEEALGS